MIIRVLETAIGVALGLFLVWAATGRCPVCGRKGKRDDAQGNHNRG